MIYTTLNKIRQHEPCEDSWRKLLTGLNKTTPDDEPLPFARIVEINGLVDALWATRSAPEHHKDWRLFAVWCAREALRYTNDWRAVAAVNITERYAHGMASQAQLDTAARTAADAGRVDATYAAYAAAAAGRSAAADAAYAAYAVYYADDASEAQRERFLGIVT